jgi:hypothetical protein
MGGGGAQRPVLHVNGPKRHVLAAHGRLARLSDPATKKLYAVLWVDEMKESD